jgi:hypothetical protein
MMQSIKKGQKENQARTALVQRLAIHNILGAALFLPQLKCA